jgi:hypothetical protein
MGPFTWVGGTDIIDLAAVALTPKSVILIVYVRRRDQAR